MCDDLEALESIRNTTSPKLQKQLGGAITSNEDWERVKVSTMSEICTKKFAQNEEIKAFLLETGTTYLVEDNPNCDFWGLGMSRNHPESHNARDMPGNQMGKIHMAIRQTYLDAREN